MKLSVLMENESTCGSKFKAEHGLSVHIEHNGNRYLLDTGATGAFCDNARSMGIDLRAVDAAVLSHAHDDHAGGLDAFFRVNEKAPAYMSRYADRAYFIRMLGVRFNIGVPRELFERYPNRIRFVNGLAEIGDGAYLLPNSGERSVPLGKSSRQLLTQRDGKLERDTFEHELSLVLCDGGGLVILTGCSHNGIVNMTEHVVRLFPGERVRAVVGGFHLMGFPFKNSLGEPRDVVLDIAARMSRLGVGRVYTAHCTGQKAFGLLKSVMGDSIVYLHAGDRVEV